MITIVPPKSAVAIDFFAGRGGEVRDWQEGQARRESFDKYLADLVQQGRQPAEDPVPPDESTAE